MTYRYIISYLFGNRRQPCSFSPHPARVNPHTQGRELPLFLDSSNCLAVGDKNCMVSQECCLAGEAVKESCRTPLRRAWPLPPAPAPSAAV